MKFAGMLSALVVASLLVLASGLAYGADKLTIAIMQDDKDAARKFKPLEAYLASKGVLISFAEMPNYSTAAYSFGARKVDAMFSGSGVAGVFIIKDLAIPVLRPIDKDGASTYHAVILAPKGSPAFTGNADYFKNKRVVFTALASSGEIFFRSIPNIKINKKDILKMASHGAAIDALSKGAADVAIVKNHVWEKHAGEYPNIAKVGEDNGENPDNTLIVSQKCDMKVVSKVSEALLAIKNDNSPEAKAVREQMGIKGYVRTTNKDFRHTLDMLKRAGVDASFDFTFPLR